MTQQETGQVYMLINILYWKLQAFQGKQFKVTTRREKKQKANKKTVKYVTPTTEHYPKNGKMGDTDPCSGMSY